jgi:hypothetical protein
MDLFVVHYIRQNQDARRDGWAAAWTIEADTTRRAGEAIETLAVAVGRGVKWLVVAAVDLLRGSTSTSIPVRVAARHQHVELAARNDDRAAA